MAQLFSLPLYGDVSQTINPWTCFTRRAAGQVGLVNIDLGKSGDPRWNSRSSTTSAATAGRSGR